MTNDPIQPTKVYTVQQASKVLQTSEANIVDKIKKNEIKATNLGRGYKMLGEHLLQFMGSATVPEFFKSQEQVEAEKKLNNS
jgi:excisionase family DNA binding protein